MKVYTVYLLRFKEKNCYDFDLFLKSRTLFRNDLQHIFIIFVLGNIVAH